MYSNITSGKWIRVHIKRYTDLNTDWNTQWLIMTRIYPKVKTMTMGQCHSNRLRIPLVHNRKSLYVLSHCIYSRTCSIMVDRTVFCRIDSIPRIQANCHDLHFFYLLQTTLSHVSDATIDMLGLDFQISWTSSCKRRQHCCQTKCSSIM